MKLRYEKESVQLGKLACQQLNLPKNACKEDFENMTPIQIINKLNEELYELKKELFSFNMSDLILKENMNTERILSELGDCAAVLTGLLAWLNSVKNKGG